MQIYLINQYMNLDGPYEDRFYTAARLMSEAGHRVSILTLAGGLGRERTGKKIAVFPNDQYTVIAFNITYNPSMGVLAKALSYRRFATALKKQLPDLPQADLILAASPPLTALAPVLEAVKGGKTALAVEIRELWPDAPIQRGTLKGGPLVKMARNLEQRVYSEAQHILAGSRGIYDALIAEGVSGDKLIQIPAGSGPEKAYLELLQAVKK